MSYNWINPKEISFNCILLMDRWLIRYICTSGSEAYLNKLGIALAANPTVAWYCKSKAPEIAEIIEKLTASAHKDLTTEQIRSAECFVLDYCDWAVVYVYPEMMNKNCPYIYSWDKERLFELTDFITSHPNSRQIIVEDFCRNAVLKTAGRLTPFKVFTCRITVKRPTIIVYCLGAE